MTPIINSVHSDSGRLAKHYIWPDRAAYLAAGYIPLGQYRIFADQLILCLEGEMRFYLDPAHRAQPELFKPALTCKSVLVPAGTAIDTSLVDTTGTVLALCYLNPLGQDLAVVKQFMKLEHEGIYFTHDNEAHIIAELRRLRDEDLSAADAFSRFFPLIIPPACANRTYRRIDPRIITAAQEIKASVRQNVPIAEIAAKVHLSESRLTKLFRTELGFPITQYRTRHRIVVGYVYLALGYSVTEAALAAGFASTSHFSKCFAASTGFAPSTKFLRPPYIEVLIADEIIAEVAEKSRQARVANTG